MSETQEHRPNKWVAVLVIVISIVAILVIYKLTVGSKPTADEVGGSDGATTHDAAALALESRPTRADGTWREGGGLI